MLSLTIIPNSPVHITENMVRQEYMNQNSNIVPSKMILDNSVAYTIFPRTCNRQGKQEENDEKLEAL